MKSVLRSLRKRKRRKCLGRIEIVDRAVYQDLELDTKVALIRGLIPLGLMHIEALLDAEVTALAGSRYQRKDASVPGMRHGANPGSVRLAGQRIALRVPRACAPEGEIPLSVYHAFQGPGEVDERLLKRVRDGISGRAYEAAAEALPGALGLSSSSISHAFASASAAKLKTFQARELSAEPFVALIVDGGKGLRAVVKRAFGDHTLVQRKRENGVSYLPKREQALLAQTPTARL